MKNRWSETDARAFARRLKNEYPKELALRVYSSHLLGSEPSLVLHGGGNTSVKAGYPDIFGNAVAALYIKSSGCDLATIRPFDFIPLDLGYLRRFRVLDSLSAADMKTQLASRMLYPYDGVPSVETLMHAFIEHRYVDHTHPDAILSLTNRKNAGEALVEALGDSCIVIPYITAGFELAKAVDTALREQPQARAIVLMHHGLITWGKTARLAYDATISIVSRAERYIQKTHKKGTKRKKGPTASTCQSRYRTVAPLIRGALCRAAEEKDARFILRPVQDRTVLDVLSRPDAKTLALAAPLTPDHIIRTGAFPLWIDEPAFDRPGDFVTQLERALKGYIEKYRRYCARYGSEKTGSTGNESLRAASLPRVILLPGLGAVCSGSSVAQTDVTADITRQTLAVKSQIAASGARYAGLSEKHVYAMEYHVFQQAKLLHNPKKRYSTRIALITGGAGAIGRGICAVLCEQGYNVALSDLPGKGLRNAVAELSEQYGESIAGVELDVTDPASVEKGFGDIAQRWGGIDLVVVNAGLAHVSTLAEMDIDAFRKLERVNTEGTLLILAEAARRFSAQGCGGDIVCISTKNVFAPGAQFGAYSATKAASHQLARIASLECAPMDVRVNMVAPDAVFSHGAVRSGLWAAVGPGRMRARGLDEKGLEEYYRNRNLLKEKVTAQDVGRAVLFFATRQTPTTGATIPVDGGLPDSTPR